MSWKATSVLEERMKFVAAYLDEQESFVDLCERFGISRSKGYKWVDRYEEGGIEALRDRSRRPRSNSRAVPASMAELFVALRRRHPTWGPRKLIAVIGREHPRLELPAASTIGEVLKRAGLVSQRRRRRGVSRSGPLANYDAPNSIWCADFKGWFCVAGKKCSPLTITDGFSRYLLRCTALNSTIYEAVRPIFTSAFREFGLPLAIRTDNGPPFVSLTTGGLSRLAVWWIKLGIRPERILPGHPEQNGRHERMHRTLGAETTRPPQKTFAAQQRVFDAFRLEYNTVRPHEALGQQPPSRHYRPSRRRFTSALEDPIYPKHFTTHRAYRNGIIYIANSQWYLTNKLAHELIGLEPTADGCWNAYFGPLQLGVIDLRPRRGRRFGVLVPLPPVRKRGRPRRIYREL